MLVAFMVWALHLAFVAFMVWAPFSGNETAVALHFVSTPFLWLHWALNDDTCALTLMERGLRGVPSEESFFHNLVSPIYKIQDSDVRSLSWIISILLWLVTLSKVLKRPGMIRDVFTGQVYVPKK